jgi:hypothetical protein
MIGAAKRPAKLRVSGLICRFIADIVVHRLEDLSEHEKQEQRRNQSEAVCGVPVTDHPHGIKEDEGRHQKSEQISLGQLKTERLFRGNKAEAEGDRDQQKGMVRAGSEKHSGGVPFAEEKKNGEAEGRKVINLLESPVEFPDIEMDEEDAESDTEVKDKEEQVGREAGIYHPRIDHLRLINGQNRQGCQGADDGGRQEYSGPVKYHRDPVFRCKRLVERSFAHREV